MAEIINLNRERKSRVKQANTAKAASNRVVHGLTKPQRTRAKDERDKLSRLLDQARRED